MNRIFEIYAKKKSNLDGYKSFVYTKDELNVKLRLIINFSKFLKHIKFPLLNVDKIMPDLENAFKFNKGIMIYDPSDESISCEALDDKRTSVLLNSIGYHFFIRTYIRPRINKHSSFNEMVNYRVFLSAMFNNKLMVKRMMDNDGFAKQLISDFSLILKSNLTKLSNIALLHIMTKSVNYWKIQHLQHALDINLDISIGLAYKQIYLVNVQIRKNISLNVILIWIWIAFRNESMPLFSKWKCRMKKQLHIISHYRRYSSKKVDICHQSIVNFNDLCKASKATKYKSLKPSRFWYEWRDCGYTFCKRYTRMSIHQDAGEHQPVKMKICKGCKLIYYCNKSCQKRDWKHRHKVFCQKLRANYSY